MVLDFREFIYVLTILESGGISAAAKKLYISQPSLSQYIKKLEKELGFCIFDRMEKSMQLTYMGEKYVLFAQDVLNRRDIFFQAISDYTGLQLGHIVLGVAFFRSLFYVPKLLPPFKEKYPGISVNLFEQPAPMLEKALVKGTADLIITNLPIYTPEASYEHLFDEKILLAIPPDHRICKELVNIGDRQYPVLDLSKAQDETFIMYSPSFRIRTLSDHICMDAGFTPQHVINTLNFGTGHRLASKGMGLFFGPESLLLEDIVFPRPVYATFSKGDYTWPVVIAHNRDKYLTPAIKAFIDFSKSILGNIIGQ